MSYVGNPNLPLRDAVSGEENVSRVGVALHAAKEGLLSRNFDRGAGEEKTPPQMAQEARKQTCLQVLLPTCPESATSRDMR